MALLSGVFYGWNSWQLTVRGPQQFEEFQTEIAVRHQACERFIMQRLGATGEVVEEDALAGLYTVRLKGNILDWRMSGQFKGRTVGDQITVNAVHWTER